MALAVIHTAIEGQHAMASQVGQGDELATLDGRVHTKMVHVTALLVNGRH